MDIAIGVQWDAFYFRCLRFYLRWFFHFGITCQNAHHILRATNSSMFRQANREIQYTICKNKSSVNIWWIFLEWLRFVFIDFYSNKMRIWDVIKSMRSLRANFYVCVRRFSSHWWEMFGVKWSVTNSFWIGLFHSTTDTAFSYIF